jgi:hypothetical protein
MLYDMTLTHEALQTINKELSIINNSLKGVK